MLILLHRAGTVLELAHGKQHALFLKHMPQTFTRLLATSTELAGLLRVAHASAISNRQRSPSMDLLEETSAQL